MNRYTLPLLIALGAAACDNPEQAQITEPTPQAPSLSTSTTGGVDAALSAACPYGMFVALRTVPAGADFDHNGNGQVCDRNDGTPEMPMITTLDDMVSQ